MKGDTQREREPILLSYSLACYRMKGQSNTLSHLIHSVRSAGVYAHLLRIFGYIRRVRLVALLWRIFTVVLTVLETGALLIVSTLVLLIFLPLLLFLSIGILMTALLETRRKNCTILAKTEQKRIYVMFLPTEGGVFFSANARELSARQGCAVVIVSPFWLSPRGIKKGRFYATVREEAPNLYLVRRYFFFSLRRHVLDLRETAYLY